MGSIAYEFARKRIGHQSTKHKDSKVEILDESPGFDLPVDAFLRERD